MVNIKVEREFELTGNPQIIDQRLSQWSMITEFKCNSRLENYWQFKRGSGFKVNFTGNLWDIPTTVEVQVVNNKPFSLYVSYHVKSGAVFFIGDQENKMINLFLEHLIAYLKGTFDVNDLPISNIEANEIESSIICSNCNKKIAKNYLFCPFCGLTSKSTCSNCGELIESEFNLCPFCGVEILKGK